ncbi:MAG: hypothetical protein PHS53_02840 [Candidatus Pacebacteria bacterium]|nr:hypothetical protein [Candidatus Paceibacterota bacterium]MDD5357061.1 hypothetical protein [Candidatus Paceibacterota bacterium]
MKSPLTITILIFLIIIGAVFLFWPKISGIPNPTPSPTSTETGVFCTQDAKLCPDGSYVGRIAPSCEFAKCPGTPVPPPVTGNLTLALGQKGTLGELTITPNSIIEDSRCPVDVQCIQAGRIRVNVTIGDSLNSTTVTMTLADIPTLFALYKVSITSVTPDKNSKIQILPSQYRIVFHVDTLKIADLGEHCGGNTSNPPVCAETLYCAPEPGSHLPFGDVGGVCMEKREGIVSGTVTLSPVCPVERIPPDPACAPKPYQTTVEVKNSAGTDTLTIVRTGTDGRFNLSLPYGDFTLQAVGGNPYPRCPAVKVSVNAPVKSGVDISCDTGIR